MALFLETYTIPADISAHELMHSMRRVNRGAAVTMIRCAYSLADGKMWCVTEALSEQAIRDAVMRMEFAFTLDTLQGIDSPDVLNTLAVADCVFDPRVPSPSNTGVTAGTPVSRGAT